MDKLKITVIIPNYNGEKLLPTCLDSLEKQTYRSFATIVVDNGSSDGSANLCAQRYPKVTLVRVGANRGFAYAANEGVRRARSEFVALLNNDTETDPHWLAELVGALDRRRDIAFCASRMVDFYDRSVIDSAGNCYAFNGRSIPRGFLAKDLGQYETEEEVFGACAGAALYRRTLFDSIGLFDESFVSYKEDVDLDFRAQLRGLRCLYVPGAICYHIGGATSGRRKSDLAVKLSARNSVTTFIKNMPARFLPSAFPRMLFDLFFQAAYQIVKGRQALLLLRGLIGAALQLPHALAERRRIQSAARFDPAYLKNLLRTGDAEVKLYRQRCRAAQSR
ncbi:MAG: glycosyltransferase family 2 protein [Candidatus Aureabacteria bacterium]|nr:glycosyltransferase family 2 protein [Candidatus Auribacterota bacterium]